MKTKNNTQTISTLAVLAGASLVCSASLQAANLIVNGDFVSTGGGNNAAFVDPTGDWTNITGMVHYNDNNLGTGDYVYVWPAGSMDQDVSAAWTTASAIDISLITAAASWGAAGGDVLVELRNTSDVVLWDNTVGVTTTATTHSWSIDASTLAATEGEDLNLRISATGNGTAIDDVSLEVNAVPEPSSAALLGLGGLALILRRRK